jgi:hypothetical protein
MPYLAHIKSLANTWKPLRHLADFMEVGTTPLLWGQMSSEEHKERCSRTNVTFLEYAPEAAEPKSIPITTAGALKETLAALSHEEPGEPPLRLFIVEDLSQQVIESLGSRFDIDPNFFRDQIDDYVWYNTRDAWATAPSLASTMKQRNWFRMRNMRLRHYDSKASFEAAKLEAAEWNVLRRPDNDQNHWLYRDADDAVVSIMRTRTTIWIGKDKHCGNGTVGIVLLDPTIKEGNPIWYDRANWLPPPSMENSSPPSITLSQSWYKDIVQMTKAYPWYEAASGHAIEPQVLTAPAIHTICAEWLVVCEYVKSRLSQIEWELEMPNVFRSKGDAIDNSLTRLHTWRRQLPVFREMVTETIENSLPAAQRLTTAPHDAAAKAAAFADIDADFTRILKALNELQDRVDRLTAIVTSEISIEDSRRGLEENHNLARLTWLATTFIPLTFVSGLFSMSEDVTALKTTYGWYFAAAVPFTMFVLAIGLSVGGGALGIKSGGKGKGKGKGKGSWREKLKLK